VEPSILSLPQAAGLNKAERRYLKIIFEPQAATARIYNHQPGIIKLALNYKIIDYI